MDQGAILKRLMNRGNKEDIFHSSAYGKAQNGGSMGASSMETFAARRKIDENRQTIKGYGNSALVGRSLGNGPRAKTYTPPAPNAGRMTSGSARPPMPPRNPGISR